MTAKLDVRPDLLNPFDSVHDGTPAALAHVLGGVLYSLIQ